MQSSPSKTVCIPAGLVSFPQEARVPFLKRKCITTLLGLPLENQSMTSLLLLGNCHFHTPKPCVVFPLTLWFSTFVTAQATPACPQFPVATHPLTPGPLYMLSLLLGVLFFVCYLTTPAYPETSVPASPSPLNPLIALQPLPIPAESWCIVHLSSWLFG